MPGFGPAAEVLLVRQKDPKPLSPRPASSNVANASRGRAGQLAALRQGPPIHESVHPRGRVAGVGQEEVESIRKLGTPIAFHRLSEVVADVDRSVSDDGGPRRRECLEII